MPILPAGTPLPDREEVLGQAIPFDRAHRLPLLPDPTWWPEELDICPTVACQPRVDRATVFGTARRLATTTRRDTGQCAPFLPPLGRVHVHSRDGMPHQ